MPIDYENHDEKRPDQQKEYVYTCPWPKCMHTIRSYTENGLVSLRDSHYAGHVVDRERAAKMNLTAEDRKFLRGLKILVPE